MFDIPTARLNNQGNTDQIFSYDPQSALLSCSWLFFLHRSSYTVKLSGYCIKKGRGKMEEMSPRQQAMRQAETPKRLDWKASCWSCSLFTEQKLKWANLHYVLRGKEQWNWDSRHRNWQKSINIFYIYISSVQLYSNDNILPKRPKAGNTCLYLKKHLSHQNMDPKMHSKS